VCFTSIILFLFESSYAPGVLVEPKGAKTTASEELSTKTNHVKNTPAGSHVTTEPVQSTLAIAKSTLIFLSYENIFGITI